MACGVMYFPLKYGGILKSGRMYNVRNADYNAMSVQFFWEGNLGKFLYRTSLLVEHCIRGMFEPILSV